MLYRYDATFVSNCTLLRWEVLPAPNVFEEGPITDTEHFQLIHWHTPIANHAGVMPRGTIRVTNDCNATQTASASIVLLSLRGIMPSAVRFRGSTHNFFNNNTYTVSYMDRTSFSVNVPPQTYPHSSIPITTYQWSIPDGWTASGQGSNTLFIGGPSIWVTPDFCSGGQIRVRPVDSHCQNQNVDSLKGAWITINIDRRSPGIIPTISAAPSNVPWGQETAVAFTANVANSHAMEGFEWTVSGNFTQTGTFTTTTNTFQRVHRGFSSGTVSVRAIYCGGRRSAARSVNVNYNPNTLPTLSGPTTICDQATFRIENLPSHLTATWNLPENVTRISSTHSAVTVNRNVSRPAGPRSISASINLPGSTSPMFFHRYIHVGPPNVNDISSMFNQATIHTQGFTDLVTYAGAIATYNNFGIMSAQWQQVSGVSITNLSGSPQTSNCPAQGAQVGLILHSNPGQFGQIRVRLSNQCGWSPSWATLSYLRHNPGGTFPPCRFCGLHPCICEDEEEEPDFLVHPNPVSNVLTIDFIQREINAFEAQTSTSTEFILSGAEGLSDRVRANEVFNIRLLNAQGVVVRQQRTQARTIQFDVSNLPEGTYYLHIEHDGEIEKHQIIVQRN